MVLFEEPEISHRKRKSRSVSFAADLPRVLKKEIECLDIEDANKLLRDCDLILDLRHRYLCNIDKAYLKWDSGFSSFCVTLEYARYRQGSLEDFLRVREAEFTSMDSNDCKVWICQLLEALIYLHDQKILHRNICPENVLLSGNSDVHLAFIGLPTALDDQRSNTRKNDDWKRWTAPEVILYPFDEFGDVYAFGLVCFRMLSVAVISEEDFTSTLIAAKQKPEVIGQLLDSFEAANICPSDLIVVLRGALQIERANRSTARDLLSMPTICEGMQWIRSTLAEFHRTAPDEDSREALMDNFDDLLFQLSENLDSEARIKAILDEMLALITSSVANYVAIDHVARAVHISALIEAFSAHLISKDICFAAAEICLQIVSYRLLPLEPLSQVVRTVHASMAIFQRILEKHKNETDLVRSIIRLLFETKLHGPLFPDSMVSMLVSLLSQSIDSARLEIISELCRVLSLIYTKEDRQTQLNDLILYRLLERLIQSGLIQDATLIFNGTGLWAALTLNETVAKAAVALSRELKLLMQTYRSEGKVVRNLLVIVVNQITVSELFGYKFRDSDPSGIQILRDLHIQYNNNENMKKMISSIMEAIGEE